MQKKFGIEHGDLSTSVSSEDELYQTMCGMINRD